MTTDSNSFLLTCILRDRDSLRSGAYEPEPGFYQRRIDGYREDYMRITQTQDVVGELAPDIIAALAIKLDTFHTLKVDRDLLDAEMDKLKGEVLDELNLWGVEKAVIDNIPCAVVGGESSSLDKVKFVQLGGSLKMLADATVKKPKKKHLRIGKEAE